MFILLVAAVFSVFLVCLFRRGKGKLPGNVLPGPKGVPIFGCIFEFNESTMACKLSSYVGKYGDIFQIKMLSDSVVVLSSAELIKKAFSTDLYKPYMNDRSNVFFAEHFRSKSQTAGFANGDIHLILRKYFHQGLHTYGSGLQHLENNVMTEMENLVHKIEHIGGQEFSLVNIIQRSLSNVISLALSGEQIYDEDPDVDMFWEHVRHVEFIVSSFHNFILTNFPFVRYLPGKYRRLLRRLVQIDEKIGQRYLYQQKETYVPGKVRGLADFYIDMQQKHNQKNDGFVLYDHHIISQFAEIVDSGIATSSAAILNSFAILMNYPECQRKIQLELDRVIGRGRFPTFADRDQCTYLKAFEMEAHRFIPVLPLGVPHMCNKDVEFEGFGIKANTIVMVNIWHMHHDEKVWQDPWNFRPERFLDDSGDLLPREHELLQRFLPFGIGPRNCPGQVFARTRYFLYLASMLQRWNFEFPPNQSVSCDPRDPGSFDTAFIIRVRSLNCIAKRRM